MSDSSPRSRAGLILVAAVLATSTWAGLDTDLDGIADDVDTCPDVANPLQVPLLIADNPVGQRPQFTHDETRVVVDAPHLQVATVDGSAPVIDLFALDPGREVRAFAISSDDARVVYRADAEVLDRFDLYSVALAGGPVTRLNAGLGEAGSFALAADASEVYFVAEHPDVAGVTQVFRVPIAGGTPSMIDTYTPLGLQAERIQVIHDGQRLLVLDGDLGSPLDRLGSIDLADETAVVLGESMRIDQRFAATADGMTVVMLMSDADDRVVSVPADGDGPQVELNGPGEDVRAFALTPVPVDGAYRALWTRNGVGTFSGAVVGSDTILINAQDPLFPSFGFAPDGSEVVYLNGALYAAPVMGGATTTLAPSAENARIAPDGSRVFYDDPDYGVFPERHRLWSVPRDGSAAPLRHDPAPTSGDGVEWYRPSVTSDGVFYVLDSELYWSPASQSGWIRLSELGGVQWENVAPAADGRLVVYEDSGALWARAVEPDLDADGLVEPCDCNDLDATQSPPAATVDSLQAAAQTGGTLLSWVAPPDAGPGDAYTVLRAGAADAYDAGGPIECLANRADALEAVDAAVPAAGAAYFYLVRVDNGCGSGPLAFDRPAGEGAACQP